MKTNNGFTLIEVLVAVIILAIGLLGLAGIQTVGLKNNQSAYTRSQATQLAYDIADRMRANVAGAATYTAINPPDAASTNNCFNATGCTPAEMAESDLFAWNATLTDVLPGGSGTIVVAGNVFTITITWDDDHDGDNSNNPSFQTSFRL
ncbi:MAG: type IV pilus modification protein PilV [Methylomonas sp.]|jgi:type IV pilus assembly protein PilV|uniref:type IV pilus modification protein PilV n=1 Tax=Methylomonas sp. TaxID=418 RepID=UPI0025E751C8|nr:type IV pilus modification protein PilV [Methylomonas sp.]MCK9604948.1 type IV pilus modification protein PilV [Methylomonas sp.]